MYSNDANSAIEYTEADMRYDIHRIANALEKIAQLQTIDKIQVKPIGEDFKQVDGGFYINSNVEGNNCI